MTKPGDKTWYEYIIEEEAEDAREEFGEEIAAEVRDALRESGLDESRYIVEAGHKPSVEAAGWKMKEKKDVLELRDALREQGIGDESVGVYVTPRDSKGEVAELPPEHVGTQDFEYSVFVELSRIQEATDAGAASAMDGMG